MREGGVLPQEGLPVEGEYCFFSRELRDLEKKGVEKCTQKKLKEAKDLQRDLEQEKKLKKRYQIDNVLIKASISLQTKLTEGRHSASSSRRVPPTRRVSSAWFRTGTWTHAKRSPRTGPRTWWRNCSRQ